MPFSASVIFCFSSSTLAKHFSLRTFFIWGNKQKNSLFGARLGEYRGGARELCRFGTKTAEHSAWCGQVHS